MSNVKVTTTRQISDDDTVISVSVSVENSNWIHVVETTSGIALLMHCDLAMLVGQAIIDAALPVCDKQ